MTKNRVESIYVEMTEVAPDGTKIVGRARLAPVNDRSDVEFSMDTLFADDDLFAPIVRTVPTGGYDIAVKLTGYKLVDPE